MYNWHFNLLTHTATITVLVYEILFPKQLFELLYWQSHQASSPWQPLL